MRDEPMLYALVADGKFTGRVWSSVDAQTIRHHATYGETIVPVERDLRWSTPADPADDPLILDTPTEQELASALDAPPSDEDRIAALEAKVAALLDRLGEA